MGALAWRLGEGPIALDRFRPRLEAAIAQQLAPLAPPGSVVALEHVRLTWQGMRAPLAVELDGLKASASDGSTLFAAPRLTAELALLPLLHGAVEPSLLKLDAPTLALGMTPDGQLGLKGGPPLKAGGGGANPLATLAQLVIHGATVTLAMPDGGTPWVLEGGEAAMRESLAGTYSGQLRLTLRHGDVSAPFDATLDGDGATLTLAQFDPTMLATLGPGLDALQGLETRLDGRLHLTLGPGFEPRLLTAALTAGPGSLDLPGLYDHPLPFEGWTLDAKVDIAARTVEISQLSARLGGEDEPRWPVEASARFALAGAKQGATASITARQLPVTRMDFWWPTGPSPGARRWIRENMPAGIIPQATLALDIQGGFDDPAAQKIEAHGALSVTGASVHYLGALPLVEDVAAHGAFDAGTFKIRIDSGHIRDIAVSGDILISGLEGTDHRIAMKGDLAGPFPTFLAVLDSPPFFYAKKLGIDAPKARGQAGAVLHYAFPLIADLTFDQVQFDGSAKLTGIGLPDLIDGHPITDGALDLAIDPHAMTLAGTAKLDGVAAKLTWREEFDAASKLRSRGEFSGTLTDADRTRLGIKLSDAANGAAPFTALFTLTHAGDGALEGHMDLAQVAIAEPHFGVAKPAGQPGQFGGTLKLPQMRLGAVEGLAIDAGPTLQAAGSILFDPATQQVKLVQLDRLATPRFDGRLEARPLSPGWRLDLAAPRFDATPLLADTSQAQGAAPDPKAVPLDIRFRFGAVETGHGLTLTDAAGAIEVKGEAVERAEVAGKLGTAPVSGAYRPRPGGGATLRAKSEDAGALARLFGVTDNIQGGRLSVEAVRATPGGPLDGRLEMTDFHITDAPVMARLLGAMSLTGFVDLLRGGGIAFDKLGTHFALTDSAITLTEGRVAGAAIGMTAEGRIERRADRLDLRGTLVPFYQFNQVLGKIPLLGPILAGDEGEGLFAATYHVTGPASDPSVSVNPLSVMAPGFLRDMIFERTQEGRPKG